MVICYDRADNGDLSLMEIMEKRDQFEQTLQEHGLRITQSRKAVAMVLCKNSRSHLTPEEIYNKIQKSKLFKCDQASVYRTLDTFSKLGLVGKTVFNGEASRYSLTSNVDGKKHEHYFKCMNCQKVEPFKDCFVSKKEKDLAKNGYTNLVHHLEITGLCPKCA